MTQIIVTFKLKDDAELVEGTLQLSGGKTKDLLEEIAERNEMELISWGTI